MRCWLTVGVAALVGLPGVALASPTLDGSVGAGEYSVVLNDTPSETTMPFYSTGLDISTVQYAQDGTWNYMALTVVSPPVDINGGPTSIDEQTIFRTFFYDHTGATKVYRLAVTMDAGGVSSLTLDSWTGAAWAAVSLLPADYAVTLGAGNTALEAKILQSKMSGLGVDPYVRAQLDDTGDWADDSLAGVIPEPATLGLMGLGLAGLILRRRRK
jgi:hypothetical protein